MRMKKQGIHLADKNLSWHLAGWSEESGTLLAGSARGSQTQQLLYILGRDTGNVRNDYEKKRK